MSEVGPLSPEDDVLAAELAFGLLAADEAAAAERRARVEPSFATALFRWQDHLVGLLAGGPATDQAPGAAVWTAIAATLDGAPADTTLALRRSLRRWRAGAAGLAAIAAVLLALLLVRPQPIRTAPAGGPQLVALMDAGTASTQGAATYDVATRQLTVSLRHLPRDARVPELWLIGADGTPRSLGVVGTPAVWTRLAPAAQSGRLTRGVTLAVSLEPDGGSRTGKPTGPVILSGKLA